MPEPATTNQPDGDERGRRNTLLVLFGGVLLGALDIAIVGPALPALQAAFNLQASDLSWVYNIYILFGLLGAPLHAAASDRNGRRATYLLCLGLFGVGSIIVALAPSFVVLLLGRAIQAYGAGGLLPVAGAVIADTFPESRRGRALGLIGAVFGIAFILGPLLGGLLLRYSWRWLFLINLPLIGVLVVASVRLLPTAAAAQARRFDWLGTFALGTGLVALVVGTSNVTNPRFLAWLVVAVVAAGWFVRIELKAVDPILHPRLLQSTQMRVVGVLGLTTGLVEAGMVFLPTVAVAAFAVPASTASLMLMPLVASLIAGSVFAGRAIEWVGGKRVVQFGMGMVVAGLLAFGLAETNLINFYLAGTAVGFGLASLLGAPLRYLALHEGGADARGASQGLLTLTLGTGRMLGAGFTGGFAAAGSAEIVGFRRALLVIAVVCSLSLLTSRWLSDHRPASGGESASGT